MRFNLFCNIYVVRDLKPPSPTYCVRTYTWVACMWLWPVSILSQVPHVAFFVRPTGRLPHMRRQAMDVIGEESSNRHSGGPLIDGYHTCSTTLDDCVFKQHQIHNMDMVAEKMSFLTKVAEALSRCSCTRSLTRSVHLHWAAATWISFTRRLLGVKPPTRRSKMHLRGKGKLILC